MARVHNYLCYYEWCVLTILFALCFLSWKIYKNNEIIYCEN